MGWDKLPVAIGQHLLFTLVSVAIGFALGLVLGILLSRRPKLSGVVLPVLSVFNTIPGIVFIGLLVLAWGAGTATVLVALGIYATFPVLKNTYAGLVSVDQQYIEAARGCGMSAIQSLIRVELPLALPHHHRRAAHVHRLHRQLGGTGLHDRRRRSGGLHLLRDQLQ